jgi:anti-sigma factor RsiW
MSPEKNAASDSLIALIQPFLDDELGPSERARVEAQLAADPVLRDMVEEQATVRQVLRELPREPAPQALHARVLLELDAVDREHAAITPPARVGLGQRLRSFFRGAAIMVPAGATALALFLVSRTGAESPVVAPIATATPTPQVFGAAATASPSPGVRLVGAALPAGEREPGGPVYVERRVGGRLLLDRHEPAGGPPPSAAHDYRGRSYWLGRVQGRPAVAFESDGVRHTLTRGDPQGLRDDREYMLLLSLGHTLRDAERTR